MARVAVTIHSGTLQIADAWQDFVGRASPNVFMHPAALNAVYATGFALLHTLLAWDTGTDPHKLVGIWALQERTIVPLWPAFLSAPPYDYAFISGPMVDPELIDDVVPAFLGAIETSPDLPNVLRLQYLDGDAETYGALMAALAKHGRPPLTLAERSRPFATKLLGVKPSGSTRKKLRQDWNRLSATGALDVCNDRSPTAVAEAFEAFLALEMASWKGEQGTALLCDEADAAFVRRLIADLAAGGNASVALLRLDGRPIAAQVLMYCGRMAYTWKTAFDADHAKHSPGALLVDKVTEQLFAGGDIDAIESCSPDGSFMAQLWTGRRATVDLLVDVGRAPSWNFAAVALGERAYAQARMLRNRLRATSWWPDRKRAAAASRS